MLINVGTKDELEICGFKSDKKRKIATIVFCVLTGGLLLIFLSWKLSIKLKLIHKQCSLSQAEILLVKDMYGQLWEEEVKKGEVRIKGVKKIQKYFHNKKIKYVWDEDILTFTRIRYPPAGTQISDLLSEIDGLTDETSTERREMYGENFTMIEMPTIWHLFISQAYNPFYIFQIYTVVLWCLQEYFAYSACIFLMSVISITLSIYETRKQTKVLREKMVTESTTKVIRNENVKVIASKELVPGDVLYVEFGEEQLEADLLLLEGSTVMNEAMLTGESLPISKVELCADDDSVFDSESHKKHLLYSGTKVLQVRGAKGLKALVVNTGYDTTKGEMIRSILFPKPIDFQIYSDFLRMFFIFVLIGIGAMIWSIINWGSKEDLKPVFVIIFSIDLLTFVVPPILPATITAINLWSQKRLQKSKIFCLSSNYISLAGPVDVVCFDKTGTLTEEDFSLEGVVPCEGSEFIPPVKDLNQMSGTSKFAQSIATCHSVVKTDSGNFIGHPLDMKLFQALGWKIFDPEIGGETNVVKPQFVVSNESKTEPIEYEVLKTFPFVSGEQRMTVVCKERSHSYYEVFIKGAPERIQSLCAKETVPENFDRVLEWYTKQGLRIIAAAAKPLPQNFTWSEINGTSRETLEIDSSFLGLIILQNRLKPETSPALDVLHEACISTVMITGDNLLTAANIAKQCCLVKVNQQIIFVKAQLVKSNPNTVQHLRLTFRDSAQSSAINSNARIFKKMKQVVNRNYVFGIDGESFKLISEHDQETLKKIVHRGKIFARMKPDQKIEVIELLQKLGHQVAMCGDGCNDCGALKAAHSGISLSSSEASVAAPFTSLQKDIGCVVTLIREGRATLISTYISFKYNITSCFISLTGALFAFSIFTHPTNMQYLIMDLVLITIPSIFIGNTGAAPELCPQRPTRRILHPLHIISIISFVLFQGLFFFASWQYLKSQSWFYPFESEVSVDYHRVPPGYELTTTMMELFFTFIVGAFIFSHSFPFRKGLLTNKILTLYLICSTTLCIFFTFCQADWLYNFLDFKPFPYIGYNWSLFLSVILMAELCYLWERWFLYGFIEMVFIPWLNNKMGPRQPFEILEETLNNDTKWPKLDQDSEDSEENKSSSVRHSSTDNDESLEGPSSKYEGFIRKSSKRHHFKADVVYESEMKPLTSHSIKKENSFFRRNAFKNIENEGNQSNKTLEQIQRHSSELSKEKVKLMEMYKQNALLDKSACAYNVEQNLTEPINVEPSRICPKSPDEGSNLIKEMNEQWIIIRNSLHESLKDVAPETLDSTAENRRFSSATN